jgi:hypothetical protein
LACYPASLERAVGEGTPGAALAARSGVDGSPTVLRFCRAYEVATLADEYFDPYVELGLARNATAAEIKATWVRLARDLHPDRNGSTKEANDRAARINRAHGMLKPGVREATDALLAWQEVQGQASASQGAATPADVLAALLRAYASGGSAGVLDEIFRRAILGLPERERPFWEVIRTAAIHYVKQQDRCGSPKVPPRVAAQRRTKQPRTKRKARPAGA